MLNSLLHNAELLMTLRKNALENIVGKRENADNQHFLSFPINGLNPKKDLFHILSN